MFSPLLSIDFQMNGLISNIATWRFEQERYYGPQGRGTNSPACHFRFPCVCHAICSSTILFPPKAYFHFYKRFLSIFILLLYILFHIQKTACGFLGSITMQGITVRITFQVDVMCNIYPAREENLDANFGLRF
jgi:hypothetical protein